MSISPIPADGLACDIAMRPLSADIAGNAISGSLRDVDLPDFSAPAFRGSGFAPGVVDPLSRISELSWKFVSGISDFSDFSNDLWASGGHHVG